MNSRRANRDAKFWDRLAKKYAAAPIEDMRGYEATLKAVSERLSVDHDVLEIGCGTGTTALRLAHMVQNYLATDPSPGMIAIAQQKLVCEPTTGLLFETGEPVSAGWPAESVDTVLAFNVLHLVPSLPETIRAVHGLLKPGGLLISKTPCLGMMNPLIRVAIPLMKAVGKAPTVNILRPAALEESFEQAGFEVVERAWHSTQGEDTRPYFVAKKSGGTEASRVLNPPPPDSQGHEANT